MRIPHYEADANENRREWMGRNAQFFPRDHVRIERQSWFRRLIAWVFG